MLKINIDEIGAGLNYKESIAVAALPMLAEMLEASGIVFNKPLALELYLERLGDSINIQGALHGEAVMPCGRCLGDYPHKLSGNFTLKATPKSSEKRYEKEVELFESDLDDFPYEGNTLDLRELVQEQVILTLPLAPLCRDDCRGLCPQCGSNLNTDACGCDNQQGHPAFAGLKNLL